jgi:dienelactone hydrolase
MTAEDIASLDQAMRDAGVRHTTELYEGAQQGYTMSDMGAYNEAAAERHFTALFARGGVLRNVATSPGAGRLVASGLARSDPTLRRRTRH